MKLGILRRRKLGKTSCHAIRDKATGGEVVVFRNDQPEPEGLDVLLRWGTTSTVAHSGKILNHAKAIHKASDKAGFRFAFQDAYPDDALKTYSNDLIPDTQDLFVVRPRHHSQGKHLYVVAGANGSDLSDAVDACGPGYYISPVINKSAEYRVCFFMGRVVWVARKTQTNDTVAWNVAQGATFSNVGWSSWPSSVIQVAKKAHDLCGLDLSGVDVMVEEGTDRPYVLEVNSAPSMTSDYRQSCIAKAVSYGLVNGFGTIPFGPKTTGYLSSIHPALEEKAILS